MVYRVECFLEVHEGGDDWNVLVFAALVLTGSRLFYPPSIALMVDQMTLWVGIPQNSALFHQYACFYVIIDLKQQSAQRKLNLCSCTLKFK